MKRYLKIILLCMVLTCSAYGFAYATEEDGRFVDIPVPPASSGRADFTSEEGEKQAKEYEETKNIEQTNSEVLEENFILYKGTDETVNNVVEENAIENQKIKNKDDVENVTTTNGENVAYDNNKIAIICGIVFIVIIVVIIINKIKKNSKKKK